MFYQCRLHRRFISVKAVQQNDKALRCKICKQRPASRWETQAYEQLVQMSVGEIVHESKILKGKFGAADIFLPEHNLIIMIDGEGHTAVGHHSKRVEEQVNRDKRFNAAVAETKYHLLRVAAEDMSSFKRLVTQVITSIKANKGQVLLLSPTCQAMQASSKLAAGG